MLFKKKKRMIDVRKLQRKGVVKIPDKEIVVPTTKDGFVEMGTVKQTTVTNTSATPKETTSESLFGFMDSGSSNTSDQFSTSAEGYNKREVDAKITELDNKLYKLEQRIELLEKKLDVNQPQDNVGPMGW